MQLGGLGDQVFPQRHAVLKTKERYNFTTYRQILTLPPRLDSVPLSICSNKLRGEPININMRNEPFVACNLLGSIGSRYCASPLLKWPSSTFNSVTARVFGPSSRI